jgi:ribosomal protein S18 acetylase RimI-like enzyme
MNLTFKETKDLNYEKVIDIFYEVNFLKYPEKRNKYKKAIEKAFRNSQFVVSVWDSNELVGFARVITDKSLFATIWNLIVKPDYQRKRIGTMIIKKCLNKYPDLHFFLFSGKDSVDFYKKTGFDTHRFGMYLKEGLERCIIYKCSEGMKD